MRRSNHEDYGERGAEDLVMVNESSHVASELPYTRAYLVSVRVPAPALLINGLTRPRALRPGSRSRRSNPRTRPPNPIFILRVHGARGTIGVCLHVPRPRQAQCDVR